MKVAVVGAGIVGRLITTSLLKRGCKVYLFDKASSFPERNNSASLTAAGMLAPFCELEYGTKEITKWGLRSLELWPKIIKELGSNIYFQQKGSLVICHPQDLNEFSYLQREVDRHGYRECYKVVDQKVINELEPCLAPRFNKGLFFPHEGQISPDDIFDAFNENILPHINTNFRTCVKKIENRTLFIDRGKEEFDLVFDCRGWEGKQDWKSLRGVRGEVIRLQCHSQLLNRPVRIMHPRFPIYLVPRPNNELIIGASSIESDEAGDVSVRSCLELLSAGYSALPELGEARIVEQNAQVRAAFSDHHPRVERNGNCIRVNGLFRHGYLLSPAIVEKALELAFNEDTLCISP
ncbi:MAG: FAD-dependent oxidoreductase [Bdellovibrionales bacterium]|jgi:glycine oxidase|nr:FAD-dependent oxidoreductase [Bdellovibrionales bacterium]